MGGRIQSESVDELDRNEWTICVGISGGIGSEYADQQAVVKSPQGELEIVVPGDKLGEEISIKEITERGAILEPFGEKGPEVLIVNVQDGEQQINRIQMIVPPIIKPEIK